MGPYVNPEATEDEEMFEEDSLPASEPIHELAQNIGNGIAEPGTTVSTMPPLDTNVFIPIENELIDKMKVKELREALKERGESTAGKKDDLLRRLQAAIVAKTPILSESQREAKAKDNADKGRKIGKGFPPTAQWKSLTADDTAVVEPENPSFRNPRAPTISEMDGCHVPTKHNFSNYKFDIALFTGTETKPVIQRNGRPKQIRGGR